MDPQIIELVCNEVLDRGSTISFDDIAGQDQAKAVVREMIVWPMLNPHLFKAGRPVARGQTSSCRWRSSGSSRLPLSI